MMNIRYSLSSSSLFAKTTFINMGNLSVQHLLRQGGGRLVQIVLFKEIWIGMKKFVLRASLLSFFCSLSEV